jgi:hypothetical protein
MKLDERELREVERLTLVCPQASSSRERTLSLSALLEQRRRALESRIG